MFPDAELTVVTFLDSDLDIRVVTELPADLADVLPVVNVRRVSGADPNVRLDKPVLDVDVYHSTRKDAFDLADTVRGSLRQGLRGAVVGDAVIGSVRTVVGPRWLPYDDINVRRVNASYQLVLHSA